MKSSRFTQIAIAALNAATFASAPALGALSQEAYLKASNTGSEDRFGWGVAVSGNTVAIGAPWEASSARGVNGSQANNNLPYSGAVYIFVRDGTNWSQQAYLKASNTGRGDEFGIVAAISGDTLVVGAHGEASSAGEVNGNQNDNNAPSAGAAYVFVRNGTNWTQQAYLKTAYNAAQNRFGRAVAISDDTVVIGAFYEGDRSGAAYVFVRDGTNWTEQARLTGSNTEAGDGFGSSVGISGETIIIGAGGEDSSTTGIDGDSSDNSAPDAGAAYVFVRDGTTWSQQAYLKASNAEAGDNFGRVAISGDTIVVGASSEASAASGVNVDQRNNSGSGAGAAYVFVRSGTTWTQEAYLKASNTDAGDFFGDSGVAVSGDTIVVGAWGEASAATGVDGNEADNGAPQSGAAYVFTRTGTNWSQRAYLKASNTEAFDGFQMVAVSGETVVLGALYESSNATGINGNQTNNGASSAGAAYVFTNPIAPRQLSIIQTDAQALISWPVTLTNYILEAAPSPSAISWASVTNAPIVTGTNRSVQLPLTGTAQFFRLRKL